LHFFVIVYSEAKIINKHGLPTTEVITDCIWDKNAVNWDCASVHTTH